MTIDPAKAAGHLEHKGRPYYFCSVSCMERVKADPAGFISEAAATPG
jgi:Cu+-exporting ATPase